MATTSEIQARVEALNKAIASGVRSVTLGGQTTTFNTTDSLIRARDDALAQLQASQATGRKSRTTKLVYTGRGY